MINIKNLFSSSSSKITANQSTNEIIQEIHETFYTEVNRLLDQAKVSVSNETTKQELIEKCKRLKALGFTNTKEVKEAQIEINRLNEISQINESKDKLVRAINYFSVKYPNYKFITEESVKKICEKYNLVYGSVDRYIGTVPDKNLKQIEEFKISDDDICAFILERDFMGFRNMKDAKFLSKTEQDKIRTHLYNNRLDSRFLNRYYHVEYGTCPLEIAAPLSDFDMTQAEVQNFKISDIHIPDPVVLQPVIFEGVKHYLCVSCWGLEASDELVVNQKFN